MAIKVRVRNFQSLKDATINIDGLTVVTGPNNSGKSAFIRALKGAFQNTPGNGFVRHGESQCSVEVAFGDGHTLLWEKGPKIKPTYVIDGGKPIYPGKGVPEEVQALGVVPIVANNQAAWPQVADQFTGQVFLLDQPGSVLAEAVANVDRVGALNRALRLAESDKRAATNTLKVRRVDLEDSEKTLQAYSGLDDAVALVKQAETLADRAIKIRSAYLNAEALRQRLTKAQEVEKALQGIEDVQVPTEEAAQELLSKLQGLEPLQVRRKQQLQIIKALAGIEDVQVPGDGETQALLTQLQALEPLQVRLQRVQGVIKALAGIEQVDVAVDTTNLEKTLRALDIMRGFRDRRGAAQTSISTLESQLSTAEQALVDLASEVLVTLGAIGECPTCGVVVEGTHEH